MGDVATTINLDTSIDLEGWSASVDGATSFQLGPDSETTILIEVTCPPVTSVGKSAHLTISADHDGQTSFANVDVAGVYYDGVALVKGVTDDGAPSIAERTDLSGWLLDSTITNEYELYNAGPLDITELTYTLTGSSQFTVEGIPTSLASGERANFSVIFSASDSATAEAVLTFNDHKPWNPFVMNLKGYGFTVSPNSCSYEGTVEATLTSGTLGSGADINQVLVGGVNAEVVDQGTDWVSFIIPVQPVNGCAVDVVVSSISEGQMTMKNCVYINPQGSISEVTPAITYFTGGEQITINGTDLSSGVLDDVTSVTLCGVEVTSIDSVLGSTQIVVTAAAAPVSSGSVVIASDSHGHCEKRHAFTYIGPVMTIYVPDSAALTDNAAASTASGTDLGWVPVGATVPAALVIENDNVAPLQITGVEISGPDADKFAVVDYPTEVLQDNPKALNFSCSLTTTGPHSAIMLIYNNTANSPFRVNLAAEGVTMSPFEGPIAGGQAVTLSDVQLGSYGAVEQVLVGGVSASILNYGADWIQFETPAGHWKGAKDVTLNMADGSQKVMHSAYTYHPKGHVFGDYTEDWTRWEQLPVMPHGITPSSECSFMGVGEYEGNVVALGGTKIHEYADNYYEGEMLRNSYYFDGFEWFRGPDLPFVWAGMAVEELDGTLYLMGGYKQTFDFTSIAYRSLGRGGYNGDGVDYTLKECWSFDGQDIEKHSDLNYYQGNNPTYMGSGVINDRLYTFGGSRAIFNSGLDIYRTREISSLSGTTWSRDTAYLPIGATSSYGVWHPSCVSLSNVLYSVGGYGYPQESSAMNNVYTFDGTTATEIDSLPVALGRMAVGTVGGKVYAAGGGQYYYNSPGYFSEKIYRLDESGWTELTDLALPAGSGQFYGGASLDDRFYMIGPTNFAYPARTYETGVTPSECLYSESVEVTITGTNLCKNLADVTSVSLAGIEVQSIVSACNTQLVVRSAPSFGGTGDVVIESVAYGTTVKANAFTYQSGSGCRVLDSEGTVMLSGLASDPDLGTDFGNVALGNSVTNQFSITNSSASSLTISALQWSGSADFSAEPSFALPKTLASGESADFAVILDMQTEGDIEAVLSIENSSSGVSGYSYTLNLSATGYRLSKNYGPYGGNHMITIYADTLGSGSDIATVLVGENEATLVEQGANWVTVTTPATEWDGTYDIIVWSESLGSTVLSDAYTYLEEAWIGSINYSDGTWKKMGCGVADDVVDMTFAPDGTLYAGGYFTNLFDGTAVPSRVAKFNRGRWSPVGNGELFNSAVTALAHDGNTLYVGGSFLTIGDNTIRYLTQWDGQNWVSLTDTSLNKSVYDLAYGDGKLFIGGDFDYDYNHVAIWDGTTLTDAGAYFGEDVVSLLYHNGKLYAGSDGSSVGELAYTVPGSGAWTPLATYLDDGVFALAADDSDICFGGDFTWVDEGPMDYVGQYNGNSAVAMGSGLDNRVRAMATLKEGGIVAGYYNYGTVGGVSTVDNMAVWTGSKWVPCGNETTFYGNINTLQTAYNGIYAGGSIYNTSLGISNVAFFAFAKTNSISPQVGTSAGGTQVTIPGYHLGNGTAEDIYKVTICGVEVTSIDSVSDTEIVVTTAAGAGGLGDVSVYSYDYGVITLDDGFTYEGAGIELVGMDESLIANGAAPDVLAGTHGWAHPGTTLTNRLTLQNRGDQTLNISAAQFSGADAGLFSVDCPSQISAGGSADLVVYYSPTARGTFEATLTILNDTLGSSSTFTVNLKLSAYTSTADEGPWDGAGMMTISNGVIGSGTDISSVMVGDYAATIIAQGADWVQFEMPTASESAELDITITSDSLGDSLIPDAYTYYKGRLWGYTNDWSRWEEKPRLPSNQMKYDGSAAVYNDAIYVHGGTTNFYRYTYGADAWEAMPALPEIAVYPTYPYNNRELVPFGDDLLAVSGEPQYNTYLTNLTYVYNGSEWIQGGNLPWPEVERTTFAAGAAVLGDRCYLFGGNLSGSTNTYYTTDAMSDWQLLADSNYLRYLSNQGVVVLNDKIYSLGGLISTTPTLKVYEFNGTSWTLNESMALPRVRHDMGAAVLDGAIYVMGGLYSSATSTSSGSSSYSDEAYRFVDGAWEQLPDIPYYMYRTAGCTYRGQVYAINPYYGRTYAYPYQVVHAGVLPTSGSSAGGYQVTLYGFDLCDGTIEDVERVTFGGVEADVLSISGSTQMVVRVNGGPFGAQDVKIYSTLCGVTTSSNAFTFTGSDIRVLGTNDALIAPGEAASFAKGTDFGTLQAGHTYSQTLTLSNAGDQATSISGIAVGGDAAASVSTDASSFPLTVPGSGSVELTVTWEGTGIGFQTAHLTIQNDTMGAQSNYVVNLQASLVSLDKATYPEEGGGLLTITNGVALGSGSDIYNIRFGGVDVTPSAQGENWVQFVIPAGSLGVVDSIVVQSASVGDTSLTDAFTYISGGMIYGDSCVWSEMAGLPKALTGSLAFELNDQLYVVGGFDGTSECADLYRFDGVQWHTAASLPAARSHGSGAVLNGKFYYCGGGNEASISDAVYCFDGTNWTTVASLPVGTKDATAGVVDGNLVLAGGLTASGVVTTTYSFDGTSWSEVTGLRSARTESGGAVRRDRLYMFGGRTSTGNASFSQYNFDGTSWTVEGGMSALLYGMASVPLNQHNYSFGGTDGTTTTNLAYRYDGVSWASVEAMPKSLRNAAGSFWRGAAYVVGGEDESGLQSTNVYRLTDGGVSPISGYPAGGYEVTISGINLCGGSADDITSVTLCGIAAEVQSATTNQIVVLTGQGDTGTGDVVIESQTFGTITAPNAFTYLRGEITLIGTNGVDIAQTDAASTANGTDFGTMLVGEAVTNVFGIRNDGNAPITFSGIDGGDSFTVTEFPTDELAIGESDQITVVCASQGGEQNDHLYFYDDVFMERFLPAEVAYTTSVYRVHSYGSGPGMELSTTGLLFAAPYNGTNPDDQSFDISNIGNEAFSFSNVVRYAAAGENWLTMTTNGTVAQASSTAVNASVDIDGLNVGDHIATIDVISPTATNSPLSCTITLRIAQTEQSITWSNPGEQGYVDETVLNGSASSALSPEYTVLSGPATVDTSSWPFTMNYSYTGRVTVVATQLGNMNYTAATPVTQSWDVVRSLGTITLTNLVQTYTGTARAVTVETVPSGLSHTLTYDGSASAPTDAGSYEVIGSITDDLVYGAVTNTLTIEKADQTIVFPAIAAQHTNAVVGLAATGGDSGNQVTFAVLSGPGGLSESTNLTCTAVGTIEVLASQAESANYNAAPGVTNGVRVFTVTPNNGPYAGGNTITVSNNWLGTVTNALVSSSSFDATEVSNGTDCVALQMPATTNAGLCTITLQTEEYGNIVLTDAYTYNPQGVIAGSEPEEYRIDFRGSSSSEAYPTYTSPDGTHIWTYVNRLDDWKELQTTNGTANGVYIKTYNYSSGTTGGWNGSEGYNWIASDAAYNFVYLNSSAIHTNYVVITNLTGSHYQVDVVNSYQSGSYMNSDILYSGAWTPGMDPGTDYGNWPSGGNSTAGYNLNPYDTYTSKSNYVTWANATPVDGALTVVLAKSLSTANFLNCMRIRSMDVGDAVSPASGSWTGGYQVTINGENLCDGTLSDVTNITVCGVSVTSIDSVSSTQIVVTAAQAMTPKLGNVAVYSTSYGATELANAFTYTGSALTMLGSNSVAMASGAMATSTNGTQFSPTLLGNVQTNSYSITNSGNETLTISAVDWSGSDSTYFSALDLPASVAVGAVSNFAVVYAPTAIGDHDAALIFANNSPASSFVMNLGGSCFEPSVPNGPYMGGNTVTFTNGHLGSSTNVLVNGVATTIINSADNWFTITMPAANSAGSVDIVVQTSDNGNITLADAYTYNPSGKIGSTTYDWTQWERLAGLPQGLSKNGASALNGKLYSLGGYRGSVVSNVYEFSDGSWTEVAGLPVALHSMGVASFDGAIYSVGGYNGSSAVTNVFKFDGSVWAEVHGLPAAKYELGSGVIGDLLYAYGGRSTGGGRSECLCL